MSMSTKKDAHRKLGVELARARKQCERFRGIEYRECPSRPWEPTSARCIKVAKVTGKACAHYQKLMTKFMTTPLDGLSRRRVRRQRKINR